MTDADKRKLYDSMVFLIAKNIPGFEVRFKNEHFLQVLIGFVLRWVIPFNRHYMTRYTTTVYPYVYLPSREWLREKGYLKAFKILSHEYVHLWDEKNEGHVRFKIRYLYPQVFGLFALFAFFAFLWTPALWALVALAFLGPGPAPGRRDIERRGYLMSLAVNYWRYGNARIEQFQDIVRQFTGWAYYLMWPFKSILALLQADFSSLRTGTLYMSPRSVPYAQVFELLREHGVVVDEKDIRTAAS